MYTTWLSNSKLRNLYISIVITFILNIPIINNMSKVPITFCITYVLVNIISFVVSKLNQKWLKKLDMKSCPQIKSALRTKNAYKIMDITHKIEYQKMHHYANPIQFVKDVF